MNKIDFKNLPDTSTPLSAENLNLLQDNVEDAIPTLDSAVSTSSTNGVENQAITNYVNNALNTSSGIPGYNNTYISAIGYCNYVKYGKLVIVNMNGNMSQNIPTNTVIFSNLPPLRVVDRALGSITFANNSSARVYIQGTEIKIDGATSITGWFQGLLVYLTD